jgi:hypothetical protein
MVFTPVWSRLIRFVPKGGDKVVYGEATNGFEDVGKAAEAGTLKAKVLRVPSSIFLDNVEITDEEVTVGKLLGPLSMSDVTDIKVRRAWQGTGPSLTRRQCIGLNYTKHSVSSRGPGDFPADVRVQS